MIFSRLLFTMSWVTRRKGMNVQSSFVRYIRQMGKRLASVFQHCCQINCKYIIRYTMLWLESKLSYISICMHIETSSERTVWCWDLRRPRFGAHRVKIFQLVNNYVRNSLGASLFIGQTNIIFIVRKPVIFPTVCLLVWINQTFNL